MVHVRRRSTRPSRMIPPTAEELALYGTIDWSAEAERETATADPPLPGVIGALRELARRPPAPALVYPPPKRGGNRFSISSERSEPIIPNPPVASIPTAQTTAPPNQTSNTAAPYAAMLKRFDAATDTRQRLDGVTLNTPDRQSVAASDALSLLRRIITHCHDQHAALDAAQYGDNYYGERSNAEQSASAALTALHVHLLFAHLDGISAADISTLTGLDISTLSPERVLRRVFSLSLPLRDTDYDDGWRDYRRKLMPTCDTAVILCYIQAAGITDSALRDWYPSDRRDDIFADLKFRNAILAKPKPTTSSNTDEPKNTTDKPEPDATIQSAFAEALTLARFPVWTNSDQREALLAISSSAVALRLAHHVISGELQLSRSYVADLLGCNEDRGAQALRLLERAKLIRCSFKSKRPGVPSRYELRTIRSPKSARAAYEAQRASSKATKPPSPYDDPLYRQNRDKALTRDKQRCQYCDGPATECDHVDGNPTNHALANLAACCGTCNRDRAANGDGTIGARRALQQF